jgi:hypothetical protein
MASDGDLFAHAQQVQKPLAKARRKNMKTQLIAAALVSAAAAVSSPVFAQGSAASGPESFGRSYAAPQAHRTATFRRTYNHVQAEPEFYNNGWIGEGALDRSRLGGIDPDLRPAAN